MHIFNGIYQYDKSKVPSEGKFWFQEKKIAKSEDLLNYYCWGDLRRCAAEIWCAKARDTKHFRAPKESWLTQCYGGEVFVKEFES